MNEAIIKKAAVIAQSWHRCGVPTLANMVECGWTGQAYRTVCRPNPDGVGGFYVEVWEGGECMQARTFRNDRAREIGCLIQAEIKAAKEDQKREKEIGILSLYMKARHEEWLAKQAEIEVLKHKTGRHARMRLRQLGVLR